MGSSGLQNREPIYSRHEAIFLTQIKPLEKPYLISGFLMSLKKNTSQSSETRSGWVIA